MSEMSVTDYAITHPLRPRPLAGWATLGAFACAVGAVLWLTQPYVSSSTLLLWLAGTVMLLVGWVVIVGGFVLRKPTAEEAVRLWERGSQFIILGSQAIVVWAAWAFLPQCPENVRVSLAGMFLLNSPAQVIASPENVVANRIGIAASYGSVALWFLLEGGAFGVAVPLFAFGVGSMLFLLADVIPKTVELTVEGRLASDEAVARLEAALAEVAEERDAKTRFIAAASHDLGQPLQAANLFFSQMERAKDDQRRSQAADGVRKAFDSAEQLLSHMLNHLRLEADAVDPHMAVVPVDERLRWIAAQFAPGAEAAGVNITGMPTRKLLFTDRVLLDRALSNLVDNALRHSGAKRLLLAARQAGPGRVRIWAIDDGVGIGLSETARVFDDYFRGSDSVSATAGGFGLGLSSVRRIAALLGGTAGIDPRYRGGAAFFLELPAMTTAQAAISPRRQRARKGEL
jgi:signal transduction histidine kinase